jgi:hypothetical protein
MLPEADIWRAVIPMEPPPERNDMIVFGLLSKLQ